MPIVYAFCYSSHSKQGKIERRCVKQYHLNNNLWLVLSDIHKGLYCKYCVLFTSKTGDYQLNTVLNTFVKVLFKSFVKLTSKDSAFILHASRQ